MPKGQANKTGVNFMIFILLFVENCLQYDTIYDFNLGSANSINLGRLLPQMIYHAYTGIHLNQLTSEFIDFIIPKNDIS